MKVTLFLLACSVLLASCVVRAAVSEEERCDPLAISSHCTAEFEICLRECGITGSCSETCSEATDACHEPKDAAGCFDGASCKAAGVACIPEDSPIFTNPCSPASISYHCTKIYTTCLMDAVDQGKDTSSCSMISSCLTQAIENCDESGDPKIESFSAEGEENNGPSTGTSGSNNLDSNSNASGASLKNMVPSVAVVALGTTLVGYLKIY